VVRGWPNSCALQYSFKQKSAVSPDIGEGAIVAIENESSLPVVNRWTSDLHSTGNLDQPWVVMRGLDQTDAEYSEKLSCAKLRTGIMFKVAFTEAPIPGDPVYANAGVPTLVRPDATAPALGTIVACNEFEGWIIVES
jgi:hypothetical protein